MAKIKNIPLKTRQTQDERTIRQFIEELSWVLSTYSNLDFRALPKILENNSPKNYEVAQSINDYISPNHNIHFFVGVLPNILNNKAIFPTKEKIAYFADEALDVDISKWNNKTKYEMIGQIVCMINTLNDEKLANVITALTKLISGNESAKKWLKTESETQQRNWNEVIRQLYDRESL